MLSMVATISAHHLWIQWQLKLDRVPSCRPLPSNHLGILTPCWNLKISLGSHQVSPVTLGIFGRDYISCWIPLIYIDPANYLEGPPITWTLQEGISKFRNLRNLRSLSVAGIYPDWHRDTRVRRPIRTETATTLKHQTLDYRKWETTTRNVNSTLLRLCEGNFKDFLSSDIVRPLNK